MQGYHLPLKAPTPLPISGVTTISFKVWKNQLIAYLEQDAAHYHFMPDGRYSSWLAKYTGKRITDLVGDDPEKRTIDEKRGHDPPQLTATAYENALETLLNKRNAQLGKFITHAANLCYYTEASDIVDHSTSLEWIFDSLTTHYGLETKGANFLKIASLTYKKGDQYQTFHKQYRAAFIDVLRKKNDTVKFKGNMILPDDEQLSPSFENAIVLWSLKEIDPRLPMKVRKNYGHQMTGDMTLKDLQPIIFQNIDSMLDELNESANNKAFAAVAIDKPALNALSYRGGMRGRGRGGRFQRGGRFSSNQSRNPKPTGKLFCRLCKLAGSDERSFTSHEIGNCSRLTIRDMESLRASLVLNGMITEEAAESPELEEPTYFMHPGWDDDEAAGLEEPSPDE